MHREGVVYAGLVKKVFDALTYYDYIRLCYMHAARVFIVITPI